MDEDYVREVWEETAEIGYLKEKYIEFSRIPGLLLQPQRSEIDSGLRQIRLQILSELTARQAAAEKSVITFRQQHLSERLLEREEVVEWITKQASVDGPASRYLRIPIPDGYVPARCDGRIFTEPPLTISVTTSATQIDIEVLCYASPDDQWVRRIPVRHGGTLDGLRVVSNSLARRYSWQGSPSNQLRVDRRQPIAVQLSGWNPNALNQPISSRITMEIDPTLTPGEVAQRYRNIRTRLIGARFRSMSEKHLRLAKFYGGHKEEGTTWVTLMTRWNHGEGRDWEVQQIRDLCQRLQAGMGAIDGP